MKLTKCTNGHFYDAEKYSVCPHCSGTAMNNGGDDSVTDCMPKQRTSADSSTDKTVGMNISGMGNKMLQNETIKFADSIQSQQNAPVYNRTTGQTTQEDEGKTIGYMAWRKPNNDGNVTEPIFAGAQTNSQPVVGWLVCTEGKSVGRSYNLYCGKNFIGRSSQMDVALTEDITVSRIRHAIIVYEPNNRVFFAQPGDSHELFYLNGNVVLNSVQLKDRDVITLGKTSMMFVPFCDERFGWDDK